MSSLFLINFQVKFSQNLFQIFWIQKFSRSTFSLENETDKIASVLRHRRAESLITSTTRVKCATNMKTALCLG